jgi:hypothetical protein
MKILFITEKYPPIVCSGNRVYNLAKQFSKKHDVHIFCRGNNSWLSPMPEDHNIPKIQNVKVNTFKIKDSLFLIPIMILFKLKLISNSKFYFKSAIKEIKKKPDYFASFDLVITSGPSWHSFYIAEYLFDKYNMPFILDYRDPWIIRNKKEKIDQKRIASKAKKLVSVTKFYCGQIEKYTSRKIDLIENGVDINFFKKFKLQSSKKSSKNLIIGYAGSLISYQRIDDLILAISNINKSIRKNIYVYICGALNKHSGEYKKIAKKRNVNCLFYGHQDITSMAKILSKCDAFYLGNKIKNATSGKFYVYLAFNKFILAHTVKNSQLGGIFSKHNLGSVSYSVDQLSKNILKIYNNRTLLNNLDCNYIKEYDWKKLANKYNKLIKNIKL